MSDENDNVKQHDWGYELTWAKKEDYCAKIFAFIKEGNKTPFFFNSETDKSLFVSSGKVKLRWIDTKNGQIFEQDLDEGKTFDCPRLMPISLQSVDANTSVAIASNGEKGDYHVVIRTESF